MNCPDCEKKGYAYSLMCSGCRTRLVLDYDCKYIRKIMVEAIEKQFGEVHDWKVGGCACTTICERKSRVKVEQSTYAERKETLIRDQRNGLRSMRRSRA